MEMPDGRVARLQWQRPTPHLLEAFRALSSADVADAMKGTGVVDPQIRHLGGPARMAGPTFTVRCLPGDNLIIHHAVDLAEPGDVIVVDGGGGLATALVGETMGLIGQRRQLAGFAVDGAVRDVASLVLPTFGRGTSPRGPDKLAAGSIGVIVDLGGVAVAPGDLIVADADGLVVVPFSTAGEILVRAQAVAAKGRATRAAIAAGTVDRGWVQAALHRAGGHLPDRAGQ